VIPRLGVAAAGDPRDAATWSGTPKALVEAAERAGVEVVGFSGHQPRALDNALYGAGTLLRYGPAARRFRHYFGPAHARNVQAFREFRAREPHLPVLHTDHMWLEPGVVSANDYLYRDLGWASWARSRGLAETLVRLIGADYSGVLGRVGHAFTTSAWARDELVAEGANPESVTVAGTGVGNRVQAFSGGKDYANGMTLCVARVRHHDKGVDLLLRGFALARRTLPHLALHLVVPRGSVRPEPGVSLHSDLDAPELVQLYERSPLYAMPARNEPYGLVYLEAQLSRMALLGSDRAAYPELAGHGSSGFIVSDLSAEGVADALVAAHSNPQRMEQMGLLGQVRAGMASWDRTMSRIVSEITSVSE
jgi:glycosyltransferase involved in cell wall biosynthesis